MDTRPPTAPCVRVTQPEGEGWLHARIRWWTTEDDGTRWALVEWVGWVARQRYTHLMCVPAEHVELLEAEDYAGVIEKGDPPTSTR